MMIKFIVPGPPVGKGRPRFRVFNGFVQTYTPPKTKKYEQKIKECYEQEYYGHMIEGYIGIEIIAYMEIPKSTSKKKFWEMIKGIIKPDKKPDIDNIAKIVLDGLNNVAYADDKCVTELSVKKRYSDDPRVEIMLENANKI